MFVSCLAACLAFSLANGAELPWSQAELIAVTLDVTTTWAVVAVAGSVY